MIGSLHCILPPTVAKRTAHLGAAAITATMDDADDDDADDAGAAELTSGAATSADAAANSFPGVSILEALSATGTPCLFVHIASFFLEK